MNKLRPWQLSVLAGLCYALIVGLMTWPALRYLSQQLIGNNEDTWIFFWNNWWLREALINGHNPLHTPFLFYPSGTSLIAHSNSFLNSFLAFLLSPLVNPVAAYNLVLLAGLWLGAMGMYLLVKDITEHTLASFLAGFVFAFAPYHISQVMAHAHLGSIHWWPFYALFLRRTLLFGRWRDAGAAALFAALTIWTGLQLGIFLALWTLIFILFFTFQRRSEIIGDRTLAMRAISRTSFIGLGTLILCAPLLWMVIYNWSILTANAISFDESTIKQTDLLSYFIPPIIHSIWGDQFIGFYSRLSFNGIFRPYIGFAVIFLMLAAILAREKEARPWLISSGIWLLLAAGSVLRFNGVVYEQFQLPYHWISTIFPLSVVRAPDRFNLLFVFSFAVLAGIGAASMARHPHLRRAVWVLGLLIVIEYLMIPIPRWKLPPGSSFLDRISVDEEAYAVIDYPMGYKNSKFWLYFQTLHDKPMVEGHISRYTPDTYAFIANQPVLNSFYQTAKPPKYLPDNFFKPPSQSPIAIGPAIRDLQAENVRYILIHRRYASDEDLAILDSILPLLPNYQDNFLTVFDLTHPRLLLLGETSSSISPVIDLVQATTQLDPSETAVELQLLTQMTSESADLPNCQLNLVGTSNSTSFSPLPSMADWQKGDLGSQKLRLSIPNDLSPGQYELQITCPGFAPFNELDSVFIGKGRPVLFRQKVDLQYEDSINLNGYRWRFEKNALHLVLQWQARADITKDYKYFIHLIDDNGAIVWQFDALHCNWDCPTSQWTANQIITDETIISLWDLPPGAYQIAVGLYDGESSDRLPVREASGNVVPDGYYILNDQIRIAEE